MANVGTIRVSGSVRHLAEWFVQHPAQQKLVVFVTNEVSLPSIEEDLRENPVRVDVLLVDYENNTERWVREDEMSTSTQEEPHPGPPYEVDESTSE
jgi:hypothetical protein